MGVNNGYIFRNGSTIESLVGTVARALDREQRVLVADSILEIFTPEELMEWVIEDNRLVIRKKDAPDLGEFLPSQELNSFLESLA